MGDVDDRPGQREPLRAHGNGPLDDGHRYYAPQSLSLADGRRVAFGWIRESLDELTGPDRSRVGVMSLPRELFLDAGGALRSGRPVNSTARAREVLLSRSFGGQATAALPLSARAGPATEISLAPAGPRVTAAGLRLGPDVPDVRIRVTAGGIEVTEGSRG